jgi:hypothetical protein
MNKNKNIPYKWDKFLIEGDELFSYMIHNFNSMFDGEIIKHFRINYGAYMEVFGYESSDNIDEMYRNDIQKELLPWIYKEFENKELFNKENWKPFRDTYCFTAMYLGYKKMFQYKKYYFQLAIDKACGECPYCENKNTVYFEHFELKMYGWVDEKSDKLQPDDRVAIPPDNIMPYEYWRRM